MNLNLIKQQMLYLAYLWTEYNQNSVIEHFLGIMHRSSIILTFLSSFQLNYMSENETIRFGLEIYVDIIIIRSVPNLKEILSDALAKYGFFLLVLFLECFS